jgi:hypothetical protein
VAALIGGLGSLGISILGWQDFDDKRRLIGAALIVGGHLLTLLSLGLFWLTIFPST